MKNTVTQKDKKPHISGLDDAAILHIKIKITDNIYSFKKSSIPQYLNPHVIKLIPDKIKPTCKSKILRFFFLPFHKSNY